MRRLQKKTGSGPAVKIARFYGILSTGAGGTNQKINQFLWGQQQVAVSVSIPKSTSHHKKK